MSATLAAMVVVVGGIASAVVAIRRWIQRLAEASSRAEAAALVAAEQTSTSNGHTLGQYVEETAAEVRQLRSEIGVLTGWSDENRNLAKLAGERAERAEHTARLTAERLDQHLLAHGAVGE